MHAGSRRWPWDDDPRPPVFILVSKNKRIARTLYEWTGEDIRPAGIPSLTLPDLRNAPDRTVMIRVDTSVVHATDTGNSRPDETTWMRLILDTAGNPPWPSDQHGRPIHRDGFEDLARQPRRPSHPPDRDIRRIVSVGMLAEGRDRNTVTHVVGPRPFQSRPLCERGITNNPRRHSAATSTPSSAGANRLSRSQVRAHIARQMTTPISTGICNPNTSAAAP